MKAYKYRVPTVIVCAVGALLAGMSPASADDGSGRLSLDQEATVKQLAAPYTVRVGAAAPAAKSTATSTQATAATVYSHRLALYRGSALMWARDTANWYFTGSTITSSSLWQEAGYIFPNTSQRKGVSRYYATSVQHAWRGNYTIGAGIVTPWGAVTVYAQDYSTDWHLYNSGAGNGHWN